MYPAALHRLSIAAVDSSHVCKKQIVKKQQKNINKMIKSWDRKTIRDLEQDCPKQVIFYLLIVVVKDNFVKVIFLFLISHLVYTLNYSKLNFGERLNHFEECKFVDTEITVHDTNFTILIDALSNYQTVLPCCLHSEVWSCVWLGNWNKSLFLQEQDVELWDSHDLPIFLPLYPLICQQPCFFLFLL